MKAVRNKCYCFLLFLAMLQSVGSFRSRLITLIRPRPEEKRALSIIIKVGVAERNHHEEEELQTIQQRIAFLNGGVHVNLKSPKQVSQAIFGDKRSTEKKVLELAATGMLSGVDASQQELAMLVLRHRQLISTLPSSVAQPFQRRNMSTATTLETGNDSANVESRPDTNADDLSPLTSNSEEQYPLSSPVLADPLEQQSPFELSVHKLFENNKSKVLYHWKEPLLQLMRPSSQALVLQLDSSQCPMGYDPLAQPFDPLRGSWDSLEEDVTRTTTAGKKGSFLGFCREQKEKYPDCVLLTRCGDFYEAFGIDAILLVEHCGLNSMAGKARAGCPIRNVQATLDGLTSQGFRVAVYEEGTDTDASAGAGASAGAKSRIKHRFLSQIVSPASPTYLYDLVLSGSADTLAIAAPSRPYVGVLSLASGYTLVEVSTEERSVRVSERLTAEAVACRIAAYPPTDPLMYMPSPAEYAAKRSGYTLPFLPTRRHGEFDSDSRLRLLVIPPLLFPEARAGFTDIARAKEIVLTTLLRTLGSRDDDDKQSNLTIDDYALFELSDKYKGGATYTSPLYVETATQLGLMNDPTIPSLTASVLPHSAPASTRRFIRRLLLNPPPPAVSDSLRNVVRFLKQDFHNSFPPLAVPPLGKMLSLLRAGQASAQVFGELLKVLHGTIAILDTFEGESLVLQSLLKLVEYESGLAADAISLRKRCADAIESIEKVLSPAYHVRFSCSVFSEKADIFSDSLSAIPQAFFERNEASWRGRVHEEVAAEAYRSVRECSRKLAEVVANDFWGADIKDTEIREGLRSPVVQDIFNNLIALKEIPKFCSGSEKDRYFHPRDRNGKLLKNRYTTDAVQAALAEYVTACDAACIEVSSVLVRLSRTLHDGGHLPAIVQASHANLVLSCAYFHACQANRLGWNVAESFEPNSEEESASSLKGVWPYWISKSSAVANSFDLSGIWLLTAPNMSGKSTLMRSTAAAALLTTCGLCAPVEPGSKVRRFDNIFVRGASSDIPTEQKSAFGAEMGDIAAMLRCCGSKSLVFVDELGRGTSPREGTRLAGAIVESMANAGISGIFATHLHDILQLPLNCWNRLVLKRMAVEKDLATLSRWTYKLEDGVCTDSMALATAEHFGLPASIIQRAQELSNFDIPALPGDIPALPGEPLEGKEDEQSDLLDLREIVSIAEKVTQQSSILIPPTYHPPASVDGRSALYILELDSIPRKYYVGETDDFRSRMLQHRRKGGMWSRFSAIVVPAPGGKSQARVWESLLIQSLSRKGLFLESISDGRSIRASNVGSNSLEAN